MVVEAKYDSLSGGSCSKEVVAPFSVWSVETYYEGVGCFLKIYWI